jgi:Flp pilus assembly protein CpaB
VKKNRGTGKAAVSKPIVLTVAALAVGVAAVFFLVSAPKESPTSQPIAPQPLSPVAPSSVDVLISIKNIDEGSELKPELFRKESKPAADFISAGVVGGFDQLTGVYAKTFIAAGQPLLSEHLTFRAPVNSVVPQIRLGYRAITIRLDRQTTNEGWARAGVRVDVVLVAKSGNTTQATIIAQNLKVLSSGTSVSSEFGGESKTIMNGESTVTLEVSTEDQKRLKLASGKGELRLLLRGDEDAGELQDRTQVSVEGIIVPPNEGSKGGEPDHGWVIIDGRKYRVIGSQLIPG